MKILNTLIKFKQYGMITNKDNVCAITVFCYYILQPKVPRSREIMLLHCHSMEFLKYQGEKRFKMGGTRKVQNFCFLFLQMFPFQRVGGRAEGKLTLNYKYEAKF